MYWRSKVSGNPLADWIDDDKESTGLHDKGALAGAPSTERPAVESSKTSSVPPSSGPTR